MTYPRPPGRQSHATPVLVLLLSLAPAAAQDPASPVAPTAAEERSEFEGHVAALEDVIRTACAKNDGFFNDPWTLLARLERHGYRAPLDATTWHGAYSHAELRTLKRASARGNIPAAILLAHHYRQACGEHEPSALGAALLAAPELLVLTAKADAYAGRARKAAERRLRSLRRR